MGCQRSKLLPVNEATLREVRMDGHRGGKSRDSNGTSVRHDEFPPPITVPHALSDFQVDIIRSTWPLVSADPLARGAAIFLNIFTTEPSIKFLFPFKKLQNEYLIRHPVFQIHVTKFMDALGDVCEQLPDLGLDTEVSRKLMVLGGHHATLAGFSVGHLGVFVKSLDHTWEKVLGEEYTDDVRDAWQEVFEFVVERLRDGYLIYHEPDQTIIPEATKVLREPKSDYNESGITLTSNDGRPSSQLSS